MISFKNFIPGIAWFFLVLVLMCLPGDDLPKVADWMSAIYFDKWVHIGLFFVLSFLFMHATDKTEKTAKSKWAHFLKIALALSVWGLTTEFIQKFFIPGRSFDLLDWAADSAGILLALLVCKRLYLK